MPLRAAPQRQRRGGSHYLHSYEAQSELGLESRPPGAFSHSSPSGFVLDSATCLPSLCSRREGRSTRQLTGPQRLAPGQEEGSGQLPFGRWLAVGRDAPLPLPLVPRQHCPQATHTFPHALHVGCWGEHKLDKSPSNSGN